MINTMLNKQKILKAIKRSNSRMIAKANCEADPIASFMAIIREEIAHEYATLALCSVRSAKNIYRHDIKRECKGAQKLLRARINANCGYRGEELVDKIDGMVSDFKNKYTTAIDGMVGTLEKAFVAHGSKYPKLLADLHVSYLFFWIEGELTKMEHQTYPFAKKLNAYFHNNWTKNREIEGFLKRLYIECRRRYGGNLDGIPPLAAKYQKQIKEMFLDYEASQQIFAENINNQGLTLKQLQND